MSFTVEVKPDQQMNALQELMDRLTREFMAHLDAMVIESVTDPWQRGVLVVTHLDGSYEMRLSDQVPHTEIWNWRESTHGSLPSSLS